MVIEVCEQSVLTNILTDTKEEMSRIFGDSLKDVRLYGSYARGEQTEESDIDVFVLVDKPKSVLNTFRRRISDFSSDLDLKYGTLLSIKLQDVETFNRFGNALPFFQNVKMEGYSIV